MINIGYSKKTAQSYTWTEIKQDKKIMKLLNGFLFNINWKPNDNTYYFILVGNGKYKYYLLRDYNKSPKAKYFKTL